jgi:YhcH/YjgK/YiaL family protein
MILDALPEWTRYSTLHPAFPQAFEFLAGADLSSLPAGRFPIDGERLFVIVDSREGRGREGARLEAHRTYLDLQVTIEGTEVIGWRPLDGCHHPAGGFDQERDIGLFEDSPETWLALPPGRFALFFPADAHAPLGGRGTLKKAIVKIAAHW